MCYRRRLAVPRFSQVCRSFGLFVALLFFSAIAPQKAFPGDDIARNPKQPAVVETTNRTDATLYIQFARLRSGVDGSWSHVLKPGQTLERKIEQARYRVVLVTYLTPQIRIEEFVLDTGDPRFPVRSDGAEKLMLPVSPVLFRRFLLKDTLTESPLRIINTDRNAARDVNLRNPDLSELARFCATASIPSMQAAIWEGDAPDKARLFHDHRALMCALDGRSLVVTGRLLESYTCDPGFANCRIDTARTWVRPGVELGILGTKDSQHGLQLPELPSGSVVTSVSSLQPIHAERARSWLASFSVSQSDGEVCPPGYRLHYQGLCINLEDEQADDPERGVRMIAPGSSGGAE